VAVLLTNSEIHSADVNTGSLDSARNAKTMYSERTRMKKYEAVIIRTLADDQREAASPATPVNQVIALLAEAIKQLSTTRVK
jgi:hypothetical protein